MIIRLLIAAALGSVIGFDRERLSWAAGLRTHMLVCVGSALVMIVSAYGFQDVVGKPGIALDPSRMAAQVVSGIGFLGAGSILLRGEVIRGLTTAASLWSVAAVGLAVGGGLYIAAAAATLIILIILAGLKPLEKRFFIARQRREVRLVVRRGAMTFQMFGQLLDKGTAQIEQFVVEQNANDAEIEEVTVALLRMLPSEFDAILNKLKAVPDVHEVSEIRLP
ncbi:putative Mg2+ transporter-C (MgtC) family protein [Collimonas sp. OK307]|uniref:MgtC/SapB family protein n=1 Tax=Collimonas sp. OK307 TaxID=1801620 RepID=UPI0008F109C2|nr:MgtC/SapB family protein [Collimonas sp. OK307]SFH63258.1 putative Mg2+ transporter-C (MgtC) family protein [Collimonas sp. OK307]